jgi:glutathione S-transferase
MTHREQPAIQLRKSQEQTVSKTTIAYFEARARIEPIRVILEELAIPYEDQRVSFEAWGEMKSDTPFGALPSYRKDDMEIFQSHAIIRHLARVHDLYGSTEAERVRCDVVEEALCDLSELVGKALWRPHFAEERADYIANELGPTLHRLEQFLKSNQNLGGFWVGSSLTFVDLVAFAILDSTGAMFPEALEKCPALRDFCDEIASRPRIAAYIESGRRPATIQLGPRGPIYDSDF